MDLVEIDGLDGGARRIPQGPSRAARPAKTIQTPSSPAAVEPWPTDRVQAALQAILLVEAGYEVPEIAHLLRRGKAAGRRAFDDACGPRRSQHWRRPRKPPAGPRPLPLLNDPRCPRCSLQPICLPDEVNQQRATRPTALATRAGSGRRAMRACTWSPSARGTRIGVRGAAMSVSDENGAKTHEVPLANLESLTLLGGVQISTQAITLLSERGVPVAFLRRPAG